MGLLDVAKLNDNTAYDDNRDMQKADRDISGSSQDQGRDTTGSSAQSTPKSSKTKRSSVNASLKGQTTQPEGEAQRAAS